MQTIEDHPERNSCYVELNAHTQAPCQAPHIYWKAKGRGEGKKHLFFKLWSPLKNSNLLPSLIPISLLPSIFTVLFILEELSDTVCNI